MEVRGRYDEALEYFWKAKGLCLLGLASAGPKERPDLAHEVLRTSRHLIHCLLDIRRTSPSSPWNRENKRQELQGYILECENLHRELMPVFKAEEKWSTIEWFMGLVFVAKAWAAVGNQEKMQAALFKRLCFGGSTEADGRSRDSVGS